jgi:hypothetical protein
VKNLQVCSELHQMITNSSPRKTSYHKSVHNIIIILLFSQHVFLEKWSSIWITDSNSVSHNMLWGPSCGDDTVLMVPCAASMWCSCGISRYVQKLLGGRWHSNFVWNALIKKTPAIIKQYVPKSVQTTVFIEFVTLHFRSYLDYQVWNMQLIL